MLLTAPHQRQVNLDPEGAFEAAWQRYYWEGGDLPRIVDFLPAEQPRRDEVACHLIEIDLERRWCAARFRKHVNDFADTFIMGAVPTPRDNVPVPRPTIADYLAQLQWSHESVWLTDLVAAEYHAQLRAGAPVSAERYYAEYTNLREQLRHRFAAIEAEIQQEKSAEFQRDAADQPAAGGPHFPGYQIEEVLGRGGMGIVYLAQDLKFPRKVAIKHLTNATRFDLESDTQSRFTDSHIVRIYDRGVCDGSPYLVCQYVDGQSLRDAIRENTLAPREAATMLIEIARAMHVVHQEGILHRDLKPANILLDKDKRPYVADFGLAKLLVPQDWAKDHGERTIQGHVLGTPAYMAPEQASGATGQDVRVDVYGLGGILYSMLLNRAPFVGPTAVEIIRAVLEEPLQEPRETMRNLPRDLNTICCKCLRKDPAQRYQTALEVVDDLQRYLDGQPILARPVSFFERFVLLCKRNWKIAGLLALIFILLIIGTTVSGLAANSAIASRDRLDSQLHVSQSGRVYQLIQQGNFGGALRLLEEMRQRNPNTPHDFAGNYALRLCHSEKFALTGHQTEILAVAVSPDGRTIASASQDGELRIASAASGDLLHTAKLSMRISKLAFNHDGTRLAIASRDHGVAIWQIQTDDCRELIRYEAHLLPVTCLAFHPTENLVASLSLDGGLHVWQADSGQVRMKNSEELTNYITELSFDADGSAVWALTSSQRSQVSAGLWRLDLASEQFEPLSLPLTAPAPEKTPSIRTAAFSPDGKRLYVIGSDGRARGYRFADLGMELKWTLPAARTRNSLVASRAWVGLWESSGKSLSLHEPAFGRRLGVIQGQVDRLTATATSHDGSVVALAARDRVIKVWDGNEEPDGLTLRGHEAFIKHVVLSPDGRTLASGGNDFGVHVWDINTGSRLHRLGKHKVELEPTSDGTPGALRVVTTFQGNQGHEAFISGLAFNSDGSILLSLGEDQKLIVWNPVTGERIREIPTKSPQPRGLVRHPQRDEVAFFDLTGQVLFFDWQQGEKTGELQVPDVKSSALAYAPDGNLFVTGGTDGLVRVWEDQSWKPRGTLQGLSSKVERLVFNRSGNLLAAADALGNIRVWELPQAEPKYSLDGFGDRIHGLNFTPNDRLLAASGRGENSLLEIWDLPQQQEVLSLAGEYQHCLMTADGTRIVASSGQMLTLRVLDSRPIDDQTYRRQPLPVRGLALVPTPPIGETPPLRGLGYFVSKSVPVIDEEFDTKGVKWAIPRDPSNHYVGVKLVLPQQLEMATEDEFREMYKEWDEEGTNPIERSRAAIRYPKQFTLITRAGGKFPGKLHGSWPFEQPLEGFRLQTMAGRHFQAPDPLHCDLMFVIFELPADCDLTGMKIQMRDDPPVPVPEETFPAPQRNAEKN